jgi:deoxyadenosine/deoxycytidine kinase
MIPDKPIISVVGPCAAGKSTLVAALKSMNYRARHIAQEHSHVKDMWKQMSNPDFLVYLDVAYDVSLSRSAASRRKKIFEKQISRLEHARTHADIYIHTDDLNPQQVLDLVLDCIGHKES